MTWITGQDKIVEYVHPRLGEAVIGKWNLLTQDEKLHEFQHGALFGGEDIEHTPHEVETGGHAYRLSCGVCGSKIGQMPNEKALIVFPPVVFMNEEECVGGSQPGQRLPESLKPNMHIYYKARAVENISDDLPKYMDKPKKFGGTGLKFEG